MVPSARDALISYWRHLFESAPFIRLYPLSVGLVHDGNSLAIHADH